MSAAYIFHTRAERTFWIPEAMKLTVESMLHVIFSTFSVLVDVGSLAAASSSHFSLPESQASKKVDRTGSAHTLIISPVMYCSTNFLFTSTVPLEDCPGTDPREVTIVVRHSSASARVGEQHATRQPLLSTVPCWAYLSPINALIPPCECPRSRSAN